MDEIREVLHGSQWAHQEELRAKSREIDAAKEELARMTTSRQEALDIQRRDLTDAFERMLSQRDQAQSAKESEINRQINELNVRFESIHTENARLHSDLAAAKRKCESLSEEAAAKEELRRQLQWQLDDERGLKTVADDTLQRQLQHAQLDLTVAKEASAKEVGELKLALEKVRKSLRLLVSFTNHLRGT